MEVIQQLHWKPPKRRSKKHPHQTSVTQSSEISEVHGSQIKIVSNEIRHYYHKAFYISKHVLRT